MPLLDALALLTKVLWDSIGNVVVAARHGMSLIQSIAKQCSGEGKPLVWTTPTGFIVEQAIYKSKSVRVETALFGGIRIQLQEQTDEIDSIKMQSSAAPNFVHSMDASHLIRSVNAFTDCGIQDIAVIHDSFGTHAGNTEMLRTCLRQEFVNLYIEDQLGSFKEEVQSYLESEIQQEVPMVGTLDLLDVLDSTYAFA